MRKALFSRTTSAVIAPLVNAYLLRFYFQIRGMPQNEFIARLQCPQRRAAERRAAHG